MISQQSNQYIQLAQSELNYTSLKKQSDVTVIWEPQEMPELSSHHLLNNISPKLETGYTRSLVGKIPSLKWRQSNKRGGHSYISCTTKRTISGISALPQKQEGDAFIFCSKGNNSLRHSPVIKFHEKSWTERGKIMNWIFQNTSF